MVFGLGGIGSIEVDKSCCFRASCIEKSLGHLPSARLLGPYFQTLDHSCQNNFFHSSEDTMTIFACKQSWTFLGNDSITVCAKRSFWVHPNKWWPCIRGLVVLHGRFGFHLSEPVGFACFFWAPKSSQGSDSSKSNGANDPTNRASAKQEAALTDSRKQAQRNPNIPKSPGGEPKTKKHYKTYFHVTP